MGGGVPVRVAARPDAASYLFMLAGYTAALIGFPSVTHPEAIFDTAVLRVQEIGIGVLCAAVIHSVIFPRSVVGVYGTRAKAVLATAEHWIADNPCRGACHPDRAGAAPAGGGRHRSACDRHAHPVRHGPYPPDPGVADRLAGPARPAHPPGLRGRGSLARPGRDRSAAAGGFASGGAGTRLGGRSDSVAGC